MENVKNLFASKIAEFRLPRYEQLPNMGLYLDQVTRYINALIQPLGLGEITSSMVSNYVKKGLIAPPVKKQYSAEQIAYLIFVSFGKSILSIESISQLFAMQKATYDGVTAYDYFCCELESILGYVSGMKEDIEVIGQTDSDEKEMLRSAIIAISHVLFLNTCFEVKNQQLSGQ